MKTASVAYQNLLYQTGSWYAADLVTIYLSDQTLRWTTADTDITVGGVTWTASTGTTKPNINPSDSRLALGSEVTTLDLIINGANTSIAGGQTVNQAAIVGRFDACRATVERTFMSTWGDTSPGKALIFDGVISDVRPSSTELRLGLKSYNVFFQTKFPKRMFQPSCPYNFGNSACGFNLSSVTTTGSLNGTPTTTVLTVAGLNAAADYHKGGVLTITSGPLSGIKRMIATDQNSGADHTFTVSPAFSTAPASGTTVSVIPGCDKTRNTCRTKYNNLAHYGGFADAPPIKT